MKWNSTGVIDSPTFRNVTINSTPATETTTTDGYLTFVGNYDPITLDADDRDKLYLNSNNTLEYPTTDISLNAFRAYFQLNNGLNADQLPVTAIKLVVDGTPTDISTINVAPSSTDPVYDMMGRKVADSLPVDNRLPRGVYIYRGKKYISVR